uniref:SH3 domain-containing protein n=1 Tax=Coturnix japonica TaxID=93934 RepID=A0A8C2U8T8_COTJA
MEAEEVYVLVEYGFEYRAKDGSVVSIQPNERYVLLGRTNQHWWHVRRDGDTRPFYVPAQYVKELPPMAAPQPLYHDMAPYGHPQHRENAKGRRDGFCLSIPLGFLCPHPYGVPASPSLCVFFVPIPVGFWSLHPQQSLGDLGHRGIWGWGLPPILGLDVPIGAVGTGSACNGCWMWGCRISPVPPLPSPPSYPCRALRTPQWRCSGAGCGAGCWVRYPLCDTAQRGHGVRPSRRCYGAKRGRKGLTGKRRQLRPCGAGGTWGGRGAGGSHPTASSAHQVSEEGPFGGVRCVGWVWG